MCRVCGTTEEINILHILYCENKNSCEYRIEVTNDLQLNMLTLTEGDLIPLYLLEWLFYKDELLIEELPRKVYSGLYRLGGRNT